jgi:uncharacterized membrane protein
MDALRKLVPLSLLFVVCDMPWLYATSNLAQDMYKKIQGGLPLQPRLAAALPVYVALAYLVQLAHSTLDSFLLGLAVYTIYEFTSYTVLAKYELGFAIADSLWGGVLFVLVRTIAIYLNIL